MKPTDFLKLANLVRETSENCHPSETSEASNSSDNGASSCNSNTIVVIVAQHYFKSSYK